MPLSNILMFLALSGLYEPAAPARRDTAPGLPGFKHAEGVRAALIDGQPRILIVSDDGSRKDGRYAHYVLLDPAQLQIAP